MEAGSKRLPAIAAFETQPFVFSTSLPLLSPSWASSDFQGTMKSSFATGDLALRGFPIVTGTGCVGKQESVVEWRALDQRSEVVREIRYC